MPELSERTKLEMRTGAQAIAEKMRTSLPPEYMEALVAIHERETRLREWEAKGKLQIERTSRIAVPMEERKTFTWSTTYRVIDRRNGGFLAQFTDIPAERAGASPSELLLANIALCLQAHGEL